MRASWKAWLQHPTVLLGLGAVVLAAGLAFAWPWYWNLVGFVPYAVARIVSLFHQLSPASE